MLGVLMQSDTVLSVLYNLPVTLKTFMLSVIMQSSIVLSGIYTVCHRLALNVVIMVNNVSLS